MEKEEIAMGGYDVCKREREREREGERERERESADVMNMEMATCFSRMESANSCRMILDRDCRTNNT
jgi:hypothetical protein